jgi:hypothetical protein
VALEWRHDRHDHRRLLLQLLDGTEPFNHWLNIKWFCERASNSHKSPTMLATYSLTALYRYS